MIRYYLDPDGPAGAIAELADAPLDDVAAVLSIQFEYMVAVGMLATPLTDDPGALVEIEFVYFDPLDLLPEFGASDIDDTRIAADAERLAGVDMGVALRVLRAATELFTAEDEEIR